MTYQKGIILSDQYDKFYILGHHFSHCFDIFKYEFFKCFFSIV